MRVAKNGGREALFKKFPRALGLACTCTPVCKIDRPDRLAVLPSVRYVQLAFPIKSGNEGPECFFKGWAIFSAEIISTTEKSATFFLLSPLRLDDPTGAKKRVFRKELDEKRAIKDPFFFFLTEEDLKKLEL